MYNTMRAGNRPKTTGEINPTVLAWKQIEALEPYILLDPARGITGASPPIAEGDNILHWVDQASGFEFFQDTEVDQVIWHEFGSSPSQVASVESIVSGNNYMICSASGIADPFEADEPFEIFTAWRHTNNDTTMRLWAIANQTEVPGQTVSMEMQGDAFVHRFEVNGTGSMNNIVAGHTLNTDLWSAVRAVPGDNYYSEVRDVGSAVPDTITTRNPQYDNVVLFAQFTVSEGGNVDGEMYAWIAFDRILSTDERAIVTSSLDRIMGLGY